MTIVDLHRSHSVQAEQAAIGPWGEEEGDPPDLEGPGGRGRRDGSAMPSTVWFGPKGSESTERELIAFPGTHNGVAVLQWPRDASRSPRLFELGIPLLWLVRDGAELPRHERLCNSGSPGRQRMRKSTPLWQD
jgi:hypothetical protein